MLTIGPMENTNHLIDALGGTNEVAKLCDVRPQAVSQWRSEGIPKARLMYLRAIRPDIFTNDTTPQDVRLTAARSHDESVRAE
jgi:hypothetical protein